MTFTLHPLFPTPIVVLVCTLLVVLLAWGTFILKQRKVPVSWLCSLGLLRAIIVVVFLLCLLQPTVSLDRTTLKKPAVLVLVDSSRDMMTADAPEGKTRLQSTLQWIEQGGLAADLASSGPVEWYRFDRQAYPTTRDKLPAIQGSQATSHYADALSSAFEQYRSNASDQPPPARVLLVSDGNDRGERDIVEVAHNLGVAVDTLAPLTVDATQGSENGNANIVGVQSPRRILQGSDSRFHVTVRQQGLANRPLTLKLKYDNQTVATHDVMFAPGEEEQQMDLTFQATKPGFREYQIELEGATHGRLIQKMTVEVVGKRHDVLFLDDDWRWEFKFLRRALEDDPNFTFTGFLSRGGQAYVQFADAERSNDLSTFPQTRAEISGFDTIILGSVNPAHWPAGLAGAIHDLVVKDGKSLVVLGGSKIAAVASNPELGSLLPVEISRETATPLPGPVQVQVNPSARESAFFFNGAQNAWSNLPPLDQIYPPLRKKPAANILLEAPQLGNDYGRIIIAAEHTVGKGRVLYLGTDTLWKWQMAGTELQPGVTSYAVFWQQTLRTLAPFRTGGMGKISLQPEKTFYEPGEKIVLQAGLQGGSGLTLRGTAKLPDGREVPLGFEADPAKEQSFTVDFDASQQGSYLFTAEAMKDNAPVGSAEVVVDVGEALASADAGVDHVNLARIAAGTGGRVLNRDDRSTWPSALNATRIPVTTHLTASLWDNFTLLILLIFLMGTDWAIRLRKGFV